MGVEIMTEQFEDRSFKRITDKFPVPMLKYLRVQHEMARKYSTTIELDENTKQFLDYVIQIYEDRLVDLEFHSSILTFKHLGRYGTYQINLRLDSEKFVYQVILCTADPKLSKREFRINKDDEVKLNIIFTLEDDADEKVKILEDAIENNRKLTSTDIEITYLTVALYMSSKLTKPELLLKIATLTNQVKGLSKEELHEIKLFQAAFREKFIADDDELKGEIDKMISIYELETLKEIYPDAFKEDRMEIAKSMKGEIESILISKFTGLSLEEIEKL